LPGSRSLATEIALNVVPTEPQQQQLIIRLGRLQAYLDPANDGRVWP
jgi:hypothetical protein